jgi:hypothetical protein
VILQIVENKVDIANPGWHIFCNNRYLMEGGENRLVKSNKASCFGSCGSFLKEDE